MAVPRGKSRRKRRASTVPIRRAGEPHYVDTRYEDFLITIVTTPADGRWRYTVEIREPAGSVVKAMNARLRARFPSSRLAADVGRVMASLWIDRQLRRGSS